MYPDSPLAVHEIGFSLEGLLMGESPEERHVILREIIVGKLHGDMVGKRTSMTHVLI